MSFDLLTAYGWQGVVLFVWVALSIGSFLNVVIHRVPIMLQREWEAQARDILHIEVPGDAETERFNLITPRSRCPSCAHQITALENIPVLSWLALRGKCASCHASIPVRYPFVELLTGICSVAVIALFGFTWFGLLACCFTWMLIALTFIDYDTTLLPDQITYPLLWLGLIANGFFAGIVPLHDAMVGALAGYLFLWCTYWTFKLLTGKEGMGYGDFKLLAGLGAWLGWQALPTVVVIAAGLGLFYALVRILAAKRAASEPIPFGPFLAVAGWATLMIRDNVAAVLFG